LQVSVSGLRRATQHLPARSRIDVVENLTPLIDRRLAGGP
jgi:hypothetical protein